MSEENVELIHIKELNLDIIAPRTKQLTEKDSFGGSKIVIVGKPATGKSTLIASILYSKKHIFPCGIAFSGSEDSNGFFRKIMPSTFVFNEYNEDQIKSFIRRQKIAKQHLPNPWAVMI